MYTTINSNYCTVQYFSQFSRILVVLYVRYYYIQYVLNTQTHLYFVCSDIFMNM